MSIHIQFFRQVILTRKVGQTDLVYEVRCVFTSRSVHARLQVSVCNSHDLYHHGKYPDTYTHTETQIQHTD